jgi:nicotinic acid phosphoribosyltransferase
VSYLRRGMTGPATFSLFVRDLPPDRGFVIAAGLEDCLAFLADFSFTSDDLAWLPATARRLRSPAPVPVAISPGLSALRQHLARQLRPPGATPASPS